MNHNSSHTKQVTDDPSSLSKSARRKKRKRREIVLSISAALVILASFVVRDIYRDAARDRIDQIESALALYETREIGDRILVQVDSVRPQPGEDTEWAYLKATLDRIAEDDYRIETLAESFPETTYNSAAIAHLRRLAYAGMARHIKLLDVREDLEKRLRAPPTPAPPAEFNREYDKTHDELAQATKEAIDLAGMYASVSMDVPGLATAEISANEFRYRALNIWSYALFVTGWLLALAGKIFHIPGLGTDG